MMLVNIRDVPYLIGMDDRPLRSLPITYEIELETVKDGIDSITLELPIEEDIIPEQKIIYRGKKYLITEIEETKVNRRVVVTAESLFVELNTTISEFQLNDATLFDAVERALRGTGWTVGTIEAGDDKYFMAEEGVTVLYILRRLSKLSGSVDVEFDTINRVVNYRVRQHRDLGVIFRYQKNVKEITKTTVFPRATRLMPIGRGGLTIASVNNGSDYIEDFSWYESLGMTKQEAKKHYTKTMIWKDERYIYAGNLMREGQRKLSQLAHPQIAYDVELSYLDVDLQVGDYAYVIDEELGIKVQVEVVKLNEYKDPTKNRVELNYLVPALHDDAGGSDVVQTSDSSVDIAYTRLNNDVVVEAGRYTEALHIALTTYAPTNLQLGIYMVGESSMDSTLDGYISMGGNKIGMPIRYKLNSGWNTISLMMILTQIQEGTNTISLYLSVDQGTFTLSRDESELALIGMNMLGGTSARLPRANVVEMVEFDAINVSDIPFISTQIPTSKTITENVIFPESLDVTDTPSIIFEGIDYTTEPPSTPTGVIVTIGLGAISLKWAENTEVFLAGYHIYVDGVRNNREVVTDTTYNITGLEHGVSYRIEITAISVWSIESEPYVIEVEMPEIELPIYFPLPGEVQNYDNWIITNRIDEIVLYAVNGEVRANIRGENIGSTETGWMSWRWVDGGWVFRSDATNYLGSSVFDHTDLILTSHDIIDDTTGDVVFWGYQGEVIFE